ncbi:MAG: hypothetical protein HY001_00615 [Candidatus Portnoybacteria bacterium]|nr:hypothetical protein [Candidatus Portnoybacteria bacterium]
MGPDNISFSHTAGIPQTIRVYGTPKGNFKLSGSFLTGKGGLDFSFDEIFRSDLFSITISVCGESGWCFGVPIPIGRIFDALFPKKAPYAYNDKSDGQIPGSDWALDCGRKRSVHINVPLDSNLGKRIISAGNSLSQALGGIFTFDFVYDPNLEIINPNTRLKQIPTELSGGQSECVVDNTSLCGADRQGIMGLILNSDQSQLLFCNQTKNDKEFQSLVKALSADGSKCALAATISGGWGNGDNNQTFVFRTGIIGMIQQWAFDLSDPKQSKIFNALIADRLLHFIVKNPGDFFGYDDNFNPVINGKLVDEISRVFPHCANVAKQQSSSCKPIPPGQVGDACHPAPPSVEQ